MTSAWCTSRSTIDRDGHRVAEDLGPGAERLVGEHDQAAALGAPCAADDVTAWARPMPARLGPRDVSPAVKTGTWAVTSSRSAPAGPATGSPTHGPILYAWSITVPPCSIRPSATARRPPQALNVAERGANGLACPAFATGADIEGGKLRWRQQPRFRRRPRRALGGIPVRACRAGSRLGAAALAVDQSSCRMICKATRNASDQWHRTGRGYG